MAKTEVRGTQIKDGSSGVDLTVDVFGVLPTANGGTNVSASGTAGNVLTSNGTNWTSAPASGGTSRTLAYFLRG